jgi:hypothetical protein
MARGGDYGRHETRQAPGWWPQIVKCIHCGRQFNLDRSYERRLASYEKCPNREPKR